MSFAARMFKLVRGQVLRKPISLAFLTTSCNVLVVCPCALGFCWFLLALKSPTPKSLSWSCMNHQLSLCRKESSSSLARSHSGLLQGVLQDMLTRLTKSHPKQGNHSTCRSIQPLPTDWRQYSAIWRSSYRFIILCFWAICTCQSQWSSFEDIVGRIGVKDGHGLLLEEAWKQVKRCFLMSCFATFFFGLSTLSICLHTQSVHVLISS